MSRYLSLIDTGALSSALDRAGVLEKSAGGPDRSTRGAASNAGASAGTMPGHLYVGPRISNYLLDSRSARAERRRRRNPAEPPQVESSGTQSSEALAPSAEDSSSVAAGPPTTPSVTVKAQPPVRTLEIPAIFDERIAPADGDFRLDRRLQAYMDWVEAGTQCRGIFIVDEEGLVLMEKGADPNLIALSAYFLNLQDRIRGSFGPFSEGTIAIDLEEDLVLYVIQAETPLGLHALGFIVGDLPDRKMIQKFREILPVVFSLQAA